jgi:hypothetical protein
MSILLIREGTQLGRVSDDLSGAVPGGNFPVDADLAFKTAQELQTLVDQSRLCEPLKTTLSKAVKTMVEADQVLVNSGGGPDAAAALSDAQSRYQDLQNLVSNPPDATGAASPSPSP